MSSTKYQRIIGDIHRRISEGELLPGDGLPSISEVSREYGVARETAVKAYRGLKQGGLIDSIPGKGFFLISDQINEAPRVLMVLNSFNPYMQDFYNAYSRALPDTVRTDTFFHHNNPDIFRNLIESYSSRYSHYVIKPFVHPDIPGLLDGLEPSRLLLLDRGEYRDRAEHYLCQDFAEGFGRVLGEMAPRLDRYGGVHLVRSGTNPHPEASFAAFEGFLKRSGRSGTVAEGLSRETVRKGHVYILVSDEDLVALLRIASERGWTPGEEIGIVSYNDSPLLEFVSRGVTGISVDFPGMGRLAAGFIRAGGEMRRVLQPRLILRRTL